MGQHMLALIGDAIAADVAQKVEELFSLASGSVLFADNTGNVVMARRLAWYVLYVRWRYSYPQLSRIWNFDQSTIRTGVLSIADDLKHNRQLQQRAKVLGV